MELHNPSIIYLYVQWSGGGKTNENYNKSLEFIKDQENKGRTCIADTRHTIGCKAQKRLLCKGDLSFRCKVERILQQLEEWVKENDNGNPCSVDDMDDLRFAVVLAGIAESHHFDKCVHMAFVGTTEAKEESEETIDGIFGEDDEAQMLAGDEENVDEEEELLHRVPLPGNLPKESERKVKWLALPRRARIAIRRLHRNFKHLPKCTIPRYDRIHVLSA